MTQSAVCASDAYFSRSCFTGKERDTESGNDYFGARYYASTMGRWLSPDWSAKVEPIPYSKLDNPQSLNLYAYVGNNPLVRTDPDGHVCVTVFGHTFCMGAPPPLPPPPPLPAPPPVPQSPGAGPAPAPPTAQNVNKAVIKSENDAREQCIKDGAQKASLGAAVKSGLDSFTEKPETSEGGNGSLPPLSSGTKAAVEQGDALVDLGKECSVDHPLSLLSPNYQGLPAKFLLPVIPELTITSGSSPK